MQQVWKIPIRRLGVEIILLAIALALAQIVFPAFAEHAERVIAILAKAALLRGDGVLAMGDSRLAGSAQSLSCGGELYVNAGMPGYTVEDMRGFEPLVATIARPARVVFFLGINDAVPENSFDERRIAADMDGMIADFAGHGARVFVVATVPNAAKGALGGSFLARDRIPAIQRITENAPARYVDVLPTLTDGAGYLRQEMSSDGMHFSAAGDAAWGQAVRAVVCR